MEDIQNHLPKSKNSGLKDFLLSIWLLIKIGLFCFIAFCLTVHSVEGTGFFFKESLSFSNTFIDDEFVSKEIERYNNASVFEKAVIDNEYIHKKLLELGRIQKSENTDSDDF